MEVVINGLTMIWQHPAYILTQNIISENLLCRPLSICLQDVNKLWEKAVQELDRDEQLVKFIEEKEQNQQQQQQSKVGPRQRAFSANSYYDSVAIPEARFKIVNGVQARIILIRSWF